jgi:uncharacterized protein
MPAATIQDIDRLSIRTRPEGPPIMKQRWNQLLFMHWPVSVSAIRRVVPKVFEIDEFGGTGWISIVPFQVSHLRAMGLPSLPGLDRFYELNLRTYVVYKGVPGIYFLSLDASNSPAVLAARFFYSLPYYKAEMNYTSGGTDYQFSSKRLNNSGAYFEGRWRVGRELPDSPEDSLSFFLTERYCLYTIQNENVCRCRVYHSPWILKDAELKFLSTNFFEVHNLPESINEPVLHFCEGKQVDLWTLECEKEVQVSNCKPMKGR